jgi:hypothetical protein
VRPPNNKSQQAPLPDEPVLVSTQGLSCALSTASRSWRFLSSHSERVPQKRLEAMRDPVWMMSSQTRSFALDSLCCDAPAWACTRGFAGARLLHAADGLRLLNRFPVLLSCSSPFRARHAHFSDRESATESLLFLANHFVRIRSNSALNSRRGTLCRYSRIGRRDA